MLGYTHIESLKRGEEILLHYICNFYNHVILVPLSILLNIVY